MATIRHSPTAATLPGGRALLRDPRLNRGTAFTAAERALLGLEGLLPPAVLSLEDRALRAYEQFRAEPDDLARNTLLAAVRPRNEVLFYKLLEDHLEEMLPVVYTPVVAQAIDNYSKRQALLGIGDWGANGMNIVVGKLAV